MPTDPDASLEFAPPPIELMGALCSLLIHDFANHLSVISGNAQCAQMFGDNAQRTAPALVSILKASEVAANLLVKCGELRRKLGSGLPQGDLALLAREISGSGARHPGWMVKTPPELGGSIAVPSHWVVFAIWELVREAGTDSGIISLSKKAPGALTGAVAQRDLVEIVLAWRAETPFPWDEIRSRHTNLNLLAAGELIKVTGGRIACSTSAPGEQEISLSIPLAGSNG